MYYCKKNPIIQGETAFGKSYLINICTTLLGQETNLYQMNSNTEMSILTGQIFIKSDFDENELLQISEVYNNMKNIIGYDKKFVDMNLKDYKEIISKIDEKLKKDNIDEETDKILKKARRTIFVINSPLSRFTHIDWIFIDSIIKENGKWVILIGIEMAPSQIPEKITHLYRENQN